MIEFDEQEAVSSIEIAAAEYRERMHLSASDRIEVMLPHWRHEQYLKHHGSQQALDEYYQARLVCQSCLAIAENAVRRLQARGILG